MSSRRTTLGDTITTTFGSISDGTPCEHISIECTQPLRILCDKPGKDIYDRSAGWDRTDNWKVKKLRNSIK